MWIETANPQLLARLAGQSHVGLNPPNLCKWNAYTCLAEKVWGFLFCSQELYSISVSVFGGFSGRFESRCCFHFGNNLPQLAAPQTQMLNCNPRAGVWQGAVPETTATKKGMWARCRRIKLFLMIFMSWFFGFAISIRNEVPQIEWWESELELILSRNWGTFGLIFQRKVLLCLFEILIEVCLDRGYNGV